MIPLYALYGSIIVFFIVVWIRIFRARSWRISKQDRMETRSTAELPTVSVCLPARNETNAMTACLESVIASTYPKLEIIVLDDESTDNTSHLIKAFAHAGVRFIDGKDLAYGWLGKNFALEQLAHEASGQYIIFMDVDTRLKPRSIYRFMMHMIRHDTTMASVIPRRLDINRASTWFASLHYFWIIFLHRKHMQSASSALWGIKQSVLRDEISGFRALRDQIQPEQRLAQEVRATGRYDLLVSDDALGISFAKKWRTQCESAVRLLLPQFGNSWSGALFGSLVFAYVLAPQYLFPYIVIHQSWWLVGLTGVIGVLAIAIFCTYTSIIWHHRWWLSWLVVPYVLWQELVFMIISIVSYATGTVTWKGRPIKKPRNEPAKV